LVILIPSVLINVINVISVHDYTSVEKLAREIKIVNPGNNK